MNKFCKKCRAETERYESGRCKACRRKSGAEYRASNSDKLNAYQVAYRKAHPDKVRALQDKWIALNPDKVKANLDKWRAANPEARRAHESGRRARKKAAGGAHSAADIRKLFGLQRGKCACCRTSIKSGYHVDHVIPLALEGSNDKLNLQLLCQACNMRKRAMHPIEFMQRQGFLI